MRQPRVSVVMPVYNAARYLDEAVASVLGQTFDDFEFIMVDDGSTDRSGAILDAWRGRDNRVRVIRRPNTGIVGALNDAVAASTAPLVARMDADDVCVPRRLELQVAYMDVHPECVAVGTRATYICPSGIPLHGSDTNIDHESIERQLLRGDGHGLIHPSAMMRRGAVEKIGGYREPYRYVEDIDLFLRLARVGRLANLDEPLLQYRVHLASTNHVRATEQMKLMRGLIAEARRERGLGIADADDEKPKPPVPHAVALEKWGWNALTHHRRWVALRYALAAWRRSPGALGPLRLIACAVRGR